MFFPDDDQNTPLLPIKPCRKISSSIVVIEPIKIKEKEISTESNSVSNHVQEDEVILSPKNKGDIVAKADKVALFKGHTVNILDHVIGVNKISLQDNDGHKRNVDLTPVVRKPRPQIEVTEVSQAE